ncbi:MAG TPA: hypothetical protein VKP69_20315, partial [Isosphaeraceae bacterium]|nr:hypothetical protein [Isosphaeraceae bacterium]
MDSRPAIDQADDPVVEDSGSRVGVRLGASVVPERGIADLDGKGGIPRIIAEVACLADHDGRIRLGLGTPARVDRLLNAHPVAGPEGCPETVPQEFDSDRVGRLDGAHLNDAPLDQLDASAAEKLQGGHEV